MSKLLNFSKTSEPFTLNVEAKTQTHAVMELYGTVGGDFFGEGITAKGVVDAIKKLPASIKTLDMHINSPGGSVFEGIAIMNRIKQYGQKVAITAHIDSLSASIATIIMLGADKVVMNEGSFIMVHKPMAGAFGNADEIEKIVNVLDDIENQMVAMYVKKTKLSKLEIKSMLTAETWMDADEAVRMGFADEKVELGFKVAACLNPKINWLNKAPEKLTTEGQLASKAAVDLQNKIKNFLARK